MRCSAISAMAIETGLCDEVTTWGGIIWPMPPPSSLKYEFSCRARFDVSVTSMNFDCSTASRRTSRDGSIIVAGTGSAMRLLLGAFSVAPGAVHLTRLGRSAGKQVPAGHLPASRRPHDRVPVMPHYAERRVRVGVRVVLEVRDRHRGVATVVVDRHRRVEVAGGFFAALDAGRPSLLHPSADGVLAAPLVGGCAAYGIARIGPHGVVGEQLEVLVELTHVDHLLHAVDEVPDLELGGDVDCHVS